MIEIRKHRPGKKTYWKIYVNDVFFQTFNTKKDAERFII